MVREKRLNAIGCGFKGHSLIRERWYSQPHQLVVKIMRLDVCPIGIGIDVKTIGDRESSGGQTGEAHSLATDQVQICIRDRKGEYMYFGHLVVPVLSRRILFVKKLRTVKPLRWKPTENFTHRTLRSRVLSFIVSVSYPGMEKATHF